ncbi:MAG: hypothetical protein ABGZ17_22570 [Planctomycetaceae bacterium]
MLSAELVLVLTVAVLAMIAGLSELAIAVNSELNDISNAIGTLNQSYEFTGFRAKKATSWKSYVPGSKWADDSDTCDKNDADGTNCDFICGLATSNEKPEAP